MISGKYLDQSPCTKISRISNLVPNEQRGVRLTSLDKVYFGDETSLDKQGLKAGWFKLETLPDAIT